MSITLLTLFGAFFIGYSYARLTKDEITRRNMYTRYSNSMLLFDRVSSVYERHYNRYREYLFNFDSSYELWSKRQFLKTYMKEKKNREKEYFEKQGEKDELSQMIN